MVKDKKIKRYELSKLMNDKEYYFKFEFDSKYSFYLRLYDKDKKKAEQKIKSEALENWERLQQGIKQNRASYQASEIDNCNKWLDYDCSIDDEIEFGISENKELGKHYVIFEKLKEGQSKRKVVLRSKNLNDLTLAVCNKIGKSPYARPFF